MFRNITSGKEFRRKVSWIMKAYFWHFPGGLWKTIRDFRISDLSLGDSNWVSIKHKYEGRTESHEQQFFVK